MDFYVRQNIARCVLSNSKHFELLEIIALTGENQPPKSVD